LCLISIQTSLHTILFKSQFLWGSHSVGSYREKRNIGSLQRSRAVVNNAAGIRSKRKSNGPLYGGSVQEKAGLDELPLRGLYFLTME